eukprot:7605448-Heterocapsa_arctica.AAC.1
MAAMKTARPTTPSSCRRTAIASRTLAGRSSTSPRPWIWSTRGSSARAPPRTRTTWPRCAGATATSSSRRSVGRPTGQNSTWRSSAR